jgi:UDP-N-acetylmuramoylalanine--D-glutamate ligase
MNERNIIVHGFYFMIIPKIDITKTYAVFGLNRTGLATIKALKAANANIVCYDDNMQALENIDVKPYVEHYNDWDFTNIDSIIFSPGIALTHPKPHPLVILAKEYNVPLISDAELLYLTLKDNKNVSFIGITGTNGKSTTTSLVTFMLNHIGMTAYAGGNIGTACFALPEPKEGEKTIYVLELSSYQLDLCHQFKPNYAVFLNLTPDHLDRHGDMLGYKEAKMRLFQNMTQQDKAIIVCADSYTQNIANELPQTNVIKVSVNTQDTQEIVATENSIIDNGIKKIQLQHQPNLQGKHNAQNAACAYAIVRDFCENIDILQQGFDSFKALPHRMQPVADYQNISFINDSKATNAEATACALSSLNNIYWILGGVAKEEGITPLDPYFNRVKKAYLIGDAAERFAKELIGVEYKISNTLQLAIEDAFTDAKKSSLKATIVLSPACASFDQFKSYEDRGEQFIKYVMDILKRV